MNSRTSTKWLARVTPTRLFAFLSLIVVGLITAALSLVISHYFKKNLLDEEWGATADYVRAEAWFHLIPSDFDAPASTAAQEHFRKFYRQTTLMPEIIRVKVYDPTMTVIWSDEPRLIGQKFPENPQLMSAVAGRTTVSIVEDVGHKPEHVYERDESPALVELYVPIVFPDSSQVAGVVETYKVPKQVFANIRKGQTLVIGTSTAGGIFLFLSLFWVFRRATRQIEDQRKALEIQSKERAVANRHILEIQTELLEAERMASIGQVASAVAHGFRGPLANLRASAQAALLDCGGCERAPIGPQSLNETVAEVDRLSIRLRELLIFSEPTNQQPVLVDLNGIVRNSLQLIASRIKQVNIRVDENLNSSIPRILGNDLILEQVFLSLLDNAIEAMPEGGGTITLTSGVDQKHDGLKVFVEVKDSGVGIPMERIQKIRKPFYTTKSSGTGLGLPIAERFIKDFDGELAVSSYPEEGSSFRLTFPAQVEV